MIGIKKNAVPMACYRGMRFFRFQMVARVPFPNINTPANCQSAPISCDSVKGSRASF